MNNPRERLQPFFHILESSPELMDRPLRLIDGEAYGATWLPIAPHGDLSGKASQTELVIFKADGEFFSAADIPGSRPLEDLSIRVDLPFVPRQDKLLSPRGFKSLMERENPAILFSQVSETVGFDQGEAQNCVLSQLRHSSRSPSGCLLGSMKIRKLNKADLTVV
jgi:hypothetical protein